MHPKTQLRAWALQADAIAWQHCSHDHRERLLDVLLSQLWNYKQDRPLWLQTLISLAEQAKEETNKAAHPHVKNIIILFRETCHYMAVNLDEHWLSYARETYDHSGNIKQDNTTRPIQQNPFVDWVDTNLDDDNDDNDQTLDFPFFPGGL